MRRRAVSGQPPSARRSDVAGALSRIRIRGSSGKRRGVPRREGSAPGVRRSAPAAPPDGPLGCEGAFGITGDVARDTRST